MKKVITYGTFDLFHEGHYRLLKRAKELGDYLIVGITTEQYDITRGKLNVVDSLITRIDNVRATGLVDEIIVEDHEGQKIEDVIRYGVDIFTLGSDWEGVFDYLKPYCEVVYLERTKNISSTQKRIDANPIIRVGVVGTGRVAKRFPREAKYVSGVTVSGVYNPHLSSAKAYADRFELAFATDTYEELLSQVDSVYIASPHETHFEYVRQALEAGKHVLCEKPMVFSVSEAKELFDIASDNGVVLMEAIKTAYCPGFNQLVALAKSGIIGEIRDVEASFSRLTDKDKREMTDLEYGGSFTEFGSYCLLAIIKLLGKDYEDIEFNSIKLENGLDAYTKVNFKYKDGLATTKTGLAVKTEGQLLIAGTKGYILAPSPWWLTKGFEVRYEDAAKIDQYSSRFLGSGIRYEISDFVRAISGDKEKAFKMTRGESIAIAGVYEKFFEAKRNGEL